MLIISLISWQRKCFPTKYVNKILFSVQVRSSLPGYSQGLSQPVTILRAVSKFRPVSAVFKTPRHWNMKQLTTNPIVLWTRNIVHDKYSEKHNLYIFFSVAACFGFNPTKHLSFIFNHATRFKTCPYSDSQLWPYRYIVLSVMYSTMFCRRGTKVSYEHTFSIFRVLENMYL